VKDCPYEITRLAMTLTPSRESPAAMCDPNGSEYQTVPNNWLLVSIAQAFGVDLVSYGIAAEAQYSNGTLPGL
jgi:hypothetical protein